MTEPQNAETKLISQFLADKDVVVTKGAYKHPYLWRCSGANCERETKTTQYEIRSGGQTIRYDYSICCFHDFVLSNRCQRHRVSNFDDNDNIIHTHCATQKNYIPFSIRCKLNWIAFWQSLTGKTK